VTPPRQTINIETQYGEAEKQQLLGALGPDILSLFHRDDVTEIFVRPHWTGFESLKDGFVQTTFQAKPAMTTILRILMSIMGQNLSLASPIVQASLPIGPDGRRVRFSAIYAGAGGIDSLLTIRIPRTMVIALDDSIATYGFTTTQARHLRESLLMPQGIMVSGGVGSGKTTFLRSLVAHIWDTQKGNDHIVVVEDEPELGLDTLPFVTSIEATPWLTFEDACKTALRQRPTRFVVGEIRGPEAQSATRVGAIGAGLYMSIHGETASLALGNFYARIRQAQELGSGQVDFAAISAAIRTIVILRRTHRQGKTEFRCSEMAAIIGASSSGLNLLPIE